VADGGVVVAIFGPTASGKSAVAEALAGRVGGEVVSADSMQAYRGLPILTNQPERPTRLVAIWPLDHPGSVGEYAPLAHAAIDEALEAHGVAVVAGGTGLYLRAALAELDLPPAPELELRASLEELYDALGAERAHRLLAGRDPAAAAAVHPNDRRRVVRALELNALGASLQPARDRLWSEDARHPTLAFGLDAAPAALAARIERRAREMFDRGAEAEARAALAGRLSVQARQIIGLREVEAGLPREEAIASVARRTRAYARRQRTWMRRMAGLVSLPADRPPGELADAILEMARARERLPARRAG